MTVGTAFRDLRDGSLVINDGSSTPLSCAVACDEGDLNWEIKREFKLDMCRGQIQGKRKGNDIPCTVNFTLKWTQLRAYTVNASDSIVPYEILNNYGDAFTSTRANNDHFAVQLVFTVVDPGGVAGNKEIITFNDFAPTSISPGEGADQNTIAVSGETLTEQPTIVRGS